MAKLGRYILIRAAYFDKNIQKLITCLMGNMRKPQNKVS